jgi:hypothetical protein
MKAVVVYESLWGSTAAIARAIAAGIGPEAIACSTADATPDVLAGVRLVVAGAPVHMMGLSKAKTREKARTRYTAEGGPAPDLSHPAMRDWLKGLRRAEGLSAAFDTRDPAQWGDAAGGRILRSLKRAGYAPTESPAAFHVADRSVIPTPDGALVPGEVERARRWGEHLAALLDT